MLKTGRTEDLVAAADPVPRDPDAAMTSPSHHAEGPPLVVGLGEALLRFTGRDHLPLEYASQLDIDVGGAELNALIAMAQLGYRCRFVSRLPRSSLGRIVLAHARRHLVDAYVDWDDDGRVGLYFVENGVPPRPTRVVYDRNDSAAARMRPGTFKWPELLVGASALYSTGITCALGRDVEEALVEGMHTAAACGARRYFDVNYRRQLWSQEGATASLKRVLPLVDVLFASRHDLSLIIGEGSEDLDEPRLADGVQQKYQLPLVVVRSVQEVAVSTVEVNLSAYAEGTVATASARAVVLDAFGAGDVAAAAFVTAHLAGSGLTDAAQRAASASAYMYTIPGDTWLLPSAEVDPSGLLTGRIVR